MVSRHKSRGEKLTFFIWTFYPEFSNTNLNNFEIRSTLLYTRIKDVVAKPAIRSTSLQFYNLLIRSTTQIIIPINFLAIFYQEHFQLKLQIHRLFRCKRDNPKKAVSHLPISDFSLAYSSRNSIYFRMCR